MTFDEYLQMSEADRMRAAFGQAAAAMAGRKVEVPIVGKFQRHRPPPHGRKGLALRTTANRGRQFLHGQ